LTGIEDGGNKSGIPTINGSIIFDERYAGKPLVYCGTGGLMPDNYKGRNSWEKPIDPETELSWPVVELVKTAYTGLHSLQLK
jgi:hypothetical protein